MLRTRLLRTLVSVAAVLVVCGCTGLKTQKGHFGGPSVDAGGAGDDGGDMTLAAADQRPDMVLPGAVGHQTSGIYANDVVAIETVAATVSSGGPYSVRHGFYIPTAQNIPSNNN
jgi:hypothetical protein